MIIPTNNAIELFQMIIPTNNAIELKIVAAELERAQRRFPPYQSAHEALAVIREEYLEFEQEVFHGEGGARAYTEATQLAAMALRYLVDIGTRGRNVASG